ncbi:hypothetical protein [Streptomyces lavendofoliae]|uniref:hypothetical protein n=1 Tax=Streptomyces lavendofoliae TaxID=67314 RepID=UPI003D8A6FC4
MRRALAPAGAALVATTGCGIQQTDVVGAGSAATVQVLPLAHDRTLLFFVDPAGEVRPVARSIEHPIEKVPIASGTGSGGQGGFVRRQIGIGTDKTLAMLMRGPLDNERAAGLRSLLAPRETVRFEITAQPDDGTAPTAERRPTLRVRTDMDVMRLEPAAVQQLVCTVAHAEDRTGRVRIVLRGRGRRTPPASCA